MPALLVTACDGLHTQPNENGEIPPGACSVAENVQITRDGIAECRRGFESMVTAVAPIVHLTPYQGTLVAQTAAKVYQSNAAVTSLTERQSATNASTHPEGATPQQTFVYLTDTGPQTYEPGRVTAGAGMIPPSEPLLTPKASGSAQATDTQLAYRIVRVRKPSSSSERFTLSPPSGRVTIANSTGSTQDVIVSTSGVGLFGGEYSMQVYRSIASASATTDPGDELGLVYERTTFTTSATVTDLVRVGTTVTATTSAATNYQAGDSVLLLAIPGITDFPNGTFVITSTPSTTSFTYEQAGAAVSWTGSEILLTTAYGFVDNVPDSLVGAALYTNSTQEGIAQGNYPPPFTSGDVAEFRGCTFYGYATDRQAYNFRLASVGSPGGVQVGDTLTFGGGVTGSVSAWSSETGSNFEVFTGGTPAENIANTARSMARVISNVSGLFAQYTSGPADVPGQISVTASGAATAAFTVTFSRPGAFFFGASTTSSANTYKNRVYYSKPNQPEAVPQLNYFDVGDADSAILRLVPLRDALIVLKQDGVFRVTGDGPWNFRVDPFDLTIRCAAPDTAAALENTVMMLTDHGVARISDTGITILSRPIEDQIRPLLVDSMRATVDTYAFAVGHDSTHRYMLWMPTSASDTSAQVAFVYDLFTESWVKWTYPARHGTVNPVDDRVYIASGTDILRERKTWTSADYQDVAGATIAAQLEWTPKFGDRPDLLHQFREVGLILGAAEWTAADIGFATDLDPTMEYVALPTITSDQVLRVMVPRTKQRGSRLRVRFRQTQAGRAFQLKGLRIVFETAGERVRR